MLEKSLSIENGQKLCSATHCFYLVFFRNFIYAVFNASSFVEFENVKQKWKRRKTKIFYEFYPIFSFIDLSEELLQFETNRKESSFSSAIEFNRSLMQSMFKSEKCELDDNKRGNFAWTNVPYWSSIKVSFPNQSKFFWTIATTFSLNQIDSELEVWLELVQE